MMRRLLVLSGAIGSGKTTLAEALRDRYGVDIVKTRELIARRSERLGPGRAEMQAGGDALDAQTGGAWIAEEIASLDPLADIVVVDAIRIVAQIDAMRLRFPDVVVHHVHLEAPMDELERRFEERARPTDAGLTYADVRRNSTEASVGELADTCDVLIDTTRNRPEDVLVRVSARLGFYHARQPCVDILVGAQWGSEGKGHVAWHLAREYDILMRVGGPNAGHSTIDPYQFHLLPSGTIVNKRATILIGAGAVISPATILREISECKMTPKRLLIDPQAMVIEDSDVQYERDTLSGIGSTAQGGGYALARKIMRLKMKDAPKPRLARDVDKLEPFIRPTVDFLEDAYASGKRIFVEGTQGSGLSLHHGPYPHATSRDTNVSGTLAECGIPPRRIRRVVMVVRSYPIRVAGTSGPLPQEITWEKVAERSGIPIEELKAKEVTTTTKRDRRVGEFDWESFRRACTLNAPTDIALSFVDYIDAQNKHAQRFDQLTDKTIRFVEEIERVADANVSLLSTRFGPRSIIDRRTW